MGHNNINESDKEVAGLKRLEQLELTERESLRLAEILETPPERNEKFNAAQARYKSAKSATLIDVEPMTNLDLKALIEEGRS